MPTLHKYLAPIAPALFVALLSITSPGCEKALDLKDHDTNASALFDELWSTMDTRYSLFGYKDVSWSDIHTLYQAKIHDGMPGKALFDTLSNMLASLKDGHITLIAGSDTSTYIGFYKPYPDNFNYHNVIHGYLQDSYSTSGPVIYKIASGIGYLYYGSFADDITDQQLDKIMSDMAQTRGLIIDVRNNTGGDTKNADKLFQRFITEKLLVKYEMSKKGPGHDDFLEAQPYYLSPAGQHYGAPVAVLTNRSCFSTCNDFVLYMSLLPNVRQVGDQTGGGGGIPRDYLLSNGWKLQYTSTVTLSPSKDIVENGIQPDIHIDITPNDISIGKDPILEAAFRSLQ